MPHLVVDDDHLGTPEASWEASGIRWLPLLDPAPFRRAVILAPHPDDEVLGAGGLIQRLLAAGTVIDVWSVTDGEACFGEEGASDDLRRRRRAESALALSRLGHHGEARERLRLPDGAVDDRAVADRLAGHLDARTLCIAPWHGDGHPDHDAVGRAARVLCSEVGAPMLQYLVWTWHWAEPDGGEVPWDAAQRLELTDREAQAKRWAAAAFTSQTTSPAPGALPVLPPPVLARLLRRWEIYLPGP